MKSLILSLVLVLAPGAVLADCASMWLTRNMAFDRAGYCFGSTLGKALFDNAGCIGKDVTLNAGDRGFVAHTIETEAAFECSIDTSRRSLDLPLVNLWLQLLDFPRRDDGESACLGWRGAPVNLRSAIGGGRVLGQISRGDDVLFSHMDQAGRSFVTVSSNGRPVSLGWVLIDYNDLSCDGFAG